MIRARLLSLLEDLNFILVSIGPIGFFTKTFSDISVQIQNVKLGFANEMQDIFHFAFLVAQISTSFCLKALYLSLFWGKK
jgi:hypothetical protein